MSGNKNNQQQGGWLKTAAIFAGGAIAGGLVAWFASEELASNNQQNQPHQSRPSQNRGATARPPTNPNQTSSEPEDLKVEKPDGVIQICEICFLSFDEIKAHGGQIIATPCGHVFCRVCIMESLRVRSDCPHCRQHVDPADLQRLYL